MVARRQIMDDVCNADRLIVKGRRHDCRVEVMWMM